MVFKCPCCTVKLKMRQAALGWMQCSLSASALVLVDKWVLMLCNKGILLMHSCTTTSHWCETYHERNKYTTKWLSATFDTTSSFLAENAIGAHLVFYILSFRSTPYPSFSHHSSIATSTKWFTVFPAHWYSPNADSDSPPEQSGAAGCFRWYSELPGFDWCAPKSKDVRQELECKAGHFLYWVCGKE